MKAKLIKTGNDFLLKDVNGETLAITSGTIKGRMLSLKNCQAIERGYDLDELAEIDYPVVNLGLNATTSLHTLHKESFKAGFQKAFELLGDKRYSEEDLRIAYFIGEKDFYVKGGQTKKMEDEYIQSLQQTEWDVEIEMERIKDETKIIGAVKGVKGSGSKITTYKSVPKLDADGCLILKTI